MKYKKPLREPYNKRLQERHELSDVEYGKLRISKMLPGFQDKKILNNPKKQ